MKKENLAEFIWFLLGDRAADNGITVDTIPYEKIDSHMRFYMEDIADRILGKIRDERNNSMALGRMKLIEFKERIGRGLSIQDAKNELMRLGRGE